MTLTVSLRSLAQHPLSLFSLLLFVRHVEMKCIHDDIVHTASSNIVHYIEDTPAGKLPREKRDQLGSTDETGELFQPLRMHIHYSLGASLDSDTKEMLRMAVKKSVQKISTVLSVIPVKGPLLLSRPDACPIVFSSGINKGKCSRLKKGYRGERCLNIFKIPDAHLEGVSIYSAANPEPVREVLKPGPGVNTTDVILYIVSKTTKLCVTHDRSVIAFASHCQVDQAGRPVAGLVNFCPFTLMRSTLTEQFLYSTALHEILHVLGFSTKLFDKFRKCKDGVCETAPAPVRSVEGQLRLVTPTVVSQTQEHFGCYTEADFGGPLEMNNAKATSHWESRLMRTSLMTAQGDNTSYSMLDPITLAVFEDSGWYQVNFSHADTFLWGRDAGCLFAGPGHCLKDKKYFCSDNSSGCHFLFLDKAKCDAMETGSQCGIYVPVPQGSCTQNAAADQDSQRNSLEVFSPSSRCFLSSVTTSPSQGQSVGFVGQCYSRQCSENGTVSVKLQNTEWMPCPTGQTIQVSGLQGEIQCPQDTEIMCRTDPVPQAPVISTQEQKGTSMSVEESTTTAAPVLIQPTRMATSRAYKTKSLLFIKCISQHFVSLEEVSLGGFGFVCSFPFLLYFTIFPFLVH